MASLTRSASLTDISGKKDVNVSSRPAIGTSNDGRFGHRSPQKKISSNFETLGPRSSSLFSHQHQNRGSVTPLRGGSSAANASLGNWQWLSSSKSFHDLQLLKQVRPSNSESAKTPGTDSRSSSRREHLEQNIVERYLDHLETLLPRYCMHLSHPTYREAANAMSLLLGSPPPIPAVPVLPGGSNQKSAYAFPGSPKKEQQNFKEVKKNVDMKSLLSSPFRSRKPNLKKPQAKGNQNSIGWGSRYSSTGSATTSSSLSKHGPSSERNNKPVVVVTNKLDEAAWQDFISPLVLLAGAEAIYADLEHVHPSPSIIQWGGLYQRVSSELLDMLPPDEKNASTEEEKTNDVTEEPGSTPSSPLSPPSSASFLGAPNLFPADFDIVRAAIANTVPTTPTRTNTTMGSGNSPAEKAARVKCQRLRSLSQWLNFKRQWLPFHESLYLTWSPENLVFVQTFAAALPNETNKNHNSNNCGDLLMESLRQEVQTTLALMEMAFWLERSSFLKTIVSAQKVKQQLLRISQKETALVLWMRTTFQDYLSIMPLMFDRIHTFATPLYGFDQQLLLDATKEERIFLDDKVVDLDTFVLEFLRRHEKAGGTDMAVSIVMDTSGIADDEDENRVPQKHMLASSDRTVRRKHLPQRVELGFAIHKEPKQKSSLPETPARRSRSNSLSRRHNEAQTQSPLTERRESSSDITKTKQWPAIYLRSTTRQTRTMSSVTGATFGLISGMSRSGSNNRGSTNSIDVISGSQTAMHLSHRGASWTSEKMSPRAKRKPARSTLSPGNVFEYEAESTHPSWPHSEWGQLEGLLESMNSETVTATVVTDNPPNSPHSSGRRQSDATSKTGKIFEQPAAISFHPDGVDPATDGEAGGRKSGAQALFESGGSLFSVDLPKQLWVSSNNHAPTTFHAVRLSKFKWMIVMVKGEEESRWHRRKARGLSDEEIRSFLDDMASKLRVSNRFLELKTCQTARVKVKDPLAPRVRGRDLGLRDAEWQSGVPEDNDELQDEVLELMKEAFNISANSPMLNRAESILTTMSGFRGGTPASRSPRDRRRILVSQRNTGPYAESSDYREGAAWFFLGPALYRQFLESTNE